MVPEQQKVKGDISTEKQGPAKRTSLIVALLVVLLVLPAAVYFLFIRSDDERIPLTATINSFEGSVMVQLAGKADTVPAGEGMEINQGDRIITGADGKLELTFADGSVTRVSPDSRIDISSLYTDTEGADTTVLKVESGSIWNAVVSLVDRNSRFEVNTPDSVAGVRGTHFYTRVSEDDGTLVRVYEGLVGMSGADDSGETSFGWFKSYVFAADDDFFLNPFQETRFQPGEPPPAEPDPFDPLDVDDFEKDNLVEDAPEAYVEVGVQASAKLVEITETRKKETEQEMEILGKELALLESLFAAETDPGRLEELRRMINKINEEMGSNSALLELLQEELEEYLEDKKTFENIRNRMEEFKELPEEERKETIRNEARQVRQQERERQPERKQRQERIAEQETVRETTRREVQTTASQLGIEEEMQRVRETPPDPDPEPDPDPDPEPDPPPADPPADPVSYNVNLSRTPSAGGTVTGGGRYESGTNVTVTASPARGYRFVNWTAADGRVVSTTRSYRFTANANRNLRANFALMDYSVDLSVRPAEGGTVRGGGTYAHGSSVTARASAESGYRFVNWTENGRAVSTSRNYTFTAESNRSLVANFSRITYEITLSADPAEGGTVSGGGNYNHNSNVRVEAVAEDGYTFAGWFEDGEKVSSEAVYSFTATAERSLTAQFALKEYTVTVSADPAEGGTVSGGGPYNHGEEVTVNAVPADDYEFINWMEDGAEVSTESEYTFIADSGRNLTANFVFAPEYTVSVSADPEEAGLVGGRGVYDHGSTVTVEVLQVSDGYSFTGWFEDGDLVSEELVFSFEVTGNRDLVASFAPEQYTVSLSVAPEEAGDVTGAGTYAFGETATAETTANTGYVFIGWHENETLVHAESSYSFEVNGNRTLVAIFSYEDIPPDYDPPVAITLVPADNATGVSTDTDISITFDQDVTEAVAGALNNVTLTAGEDKPVTDITVSLRDRTITIAHQGLDYETVYTLTVPRLTVMNDAEDPNEEVTWSFTTEPEPEPEPQHEITVKTAKFSKVSEAIYVGYILFRVSGSDDADSISVSVNGSHPFTFAGEEDGIYRFEGITAEEPGAVDISVDGATYSPDVTWEDTSDAVDDEEDDGADDDGEKEDEEDDEVDEEDDELEVIGEEID